MEFDWDETKRLSNIEKHGVDFLEALFIFDSPVVTVEDDRFDYGERRFVSIGKTNGQYFVVVHTRRDGLIRLISARKGGRHDKDLYEASIAGRTS